MYNACQQASSFLFPRPATPTPANHPDVPATELPARLRRVIGQLARRLRVTRAATGLTPTQLAVLFSTVREGALRPGELAELESLNPTMLSRVIADLTDAGLVERRPDPEDRRAALVACTPAGRRLRERVRSERNDALHGALAALSDAERDLVSAALPILEGLADGLRERRP